VKTRQARGLLVLVAIVSALLCWELAGRRSRVVRLMLSHPSLVARYAKTQHRSLVRAVATTAFESTAGLALACSVAGLLALSCLYVPSLYRVFLPPVLASQVIPLVTLAPFFILLFGIGVTSKIAMAALLCFFPIFLAIWTGMRSIPRQIHEFLTVYGATRGFRIRHVYVPMALPSILAGIRVAALLSVIGAVVAEFNGAEWGLGKNLYLAAKRLEPELMVLSLVGTSIIAAGLYAFVDLVERRSCRWYLGNNRSAFEFGE